MYQAHLKNLPQISTSCTTLPLTKYWRSSSLEPPLITDNYPPAQLIAGGGIHASKAYCVYVNVCVLVCPCRDGWKLLANSINKLTSGKRANHISYL